MTKALKITLLLGIFLNAIIGCSTVGDNREASTCGSWQEPFLFWVWHSMTPKPNSHRASYIQFVEPISYTTTDNKKLTGYKYDAHNKLNKRVAAKGYVLIALGNAMIADQVIGSFGPIAASGYDVYIYDYRGYGNSEGKRRLKAIFKDYEEIADSLNSKYKKKVFYGISLGVVIVSHLIGSGIGYDAAILDSGPSRLSPYGCPKSYDPVVNLPQDASKILVITGDKDTVLKENMTGELRMQAKKHGATAIKSPNFSHPFMDSYRVHSHRLDVIKKFILSKAGE